MKAKKPVRRLKVRGGFTKYKLLSFISIALMVGAIGSSYMLLRSKAATTPTRVLYVGDSLSYEARNPFTFTTMLSGRAQVHQLVYGGTALCDWLPRIKSEMATWQPQAISIEFVGNSFTACMKNPATGQQYTGTALVSKYMTDAQAALAIIKPYGTQVWFQGVPPMRDAGLNSQRLSMNSGFQQLAAKQSWTHYNYAGQAVEWYQTPGKYVDFLPCSSADTGSRCTNPPFTRVRALDGVHFCPVNATAKSGVTSDCPVWSSGAWRYGAEMSSPIRQWYRL
jgi:hypothetical protein